MKLRALVIFTLALLLVSYGCSLKERRVKKLCDKIQWELRGGQWHLGYGGYDDTGSLNLTVANLNDYSLQGVQIELNRGKFTQYETITDEFSLGPWQSVSRFYNLSSAIIGKWEVPTPDSFETISVAPLFVKEDIRAICNPKVLNKKDLIIKPPVARIEEFHKEPVEFFECETDRDCMVARGDCCSCNSGGTATSVNKGFAEEWEKRVGTNCGCPAMISDHWTCGAQPRCINSTCVLIEPIPEEGSITIRETALAAEDEALLLAPEIILIYREAAIGRYPGARYCLETNLTGNKGELQATLKVITCDKGVGGPIHRSVDIESVEKAWFIKDNRRVWQGDARWDWEEINYYQAETMGAPEWESGSTVDVIVKVIDKLGTEHLLKASNQMIG